MLHFVEKGCVRLLGLGFAHFFGVDWQMDGLVQSRKRKYGNQACKQMLVLGILQVVCGVLTIVFTTIYWSVNYVFVLGLLFGAVVSGWFWQMVLRVWEHQILNDFIEMTKARFLFLVYSFGRFCHWYCVVADELYGKSLHDFLMS